MENKNTNILDLLELENEQVTQEQINNLNFEVLEFKENEDIEIENNKNEDGIDFLKEIEIDNQLQISNDIIKPKSKILSGIIFFIKYIFTSGVIFSILLLTSNYSAYIEIAKSYLNPETIELDQKNMLASVTSVNIKDISKEEKNQQLETISEDFKNEQSLTLVKNKTFHSMDKLMVESKKNNSQIDVEIAPYENRIIIPKIGKNIPLVEVEKKSVNDVVELNDIFMKELENGVVRYPGTSKPGEVGNSFIFGHSSNFPWIKGDYNDVLALLDKVEFGDEIIAYYDQKKYVYKVKEKKIIKPGDVSILKRGNGTKEISIMTCWPVGTTLNRMVVVGQLEEI